MDDDLLHFTETPLFTAQIDKQNDSLELLFAIQKDLQENPERGDIIQGTNGARKARIGDKKSSKGKSGSFRYIYVYFEHAGRIYLLMFYPKTRQETLTRQDKNAVAQGIKAIRKELETKR